MNKPIFAGSINSDVVLFAFTPAVKSLTWLNPYTKETVPEVFPQMVSQHGTKQYRVKLPYAQRLLARQPKMYFLSHPDKISVRRPTAMGGFKDVIITRKVEKVGKDGRVLIAEEDNGDNKKGYPVLIDPEDSNEIENKDPLKK